MSISSCWVLHCWFFACWWLVVFWFTCFQCSRMVSCCCAFSPLFLLYSDSGHPFLLLLVDSYIIWFSLCNWYNRNLDSLLSQGEQSREWSGEIPGEKSCVKLWVNADADLYIVILWLGCNCSKEQHDAFMCWNDTIALCELQDWKEEAPIGFSFTN